MFSPSVAFISNLLPIFMYSFLTFNFTSSAPTFVKYIAFNVVPFPSCPYVFPPTVHIDPSFLVNAKSVCFTFVASPIFSGITNASVTSVLSLFNNNLNLLEFVVVPSLNCPFLLYPVSYTFPSDVIIADVLPAGAIYFIFDSVSILISVYVDLLVVLPIPSCP